MENLQKIHDPSLELIENIFRRSDPYLMVTAVDDSYGFSAAYRINNEHYVVVDDGTYTSYFLLPSEENVTKDDLYQLLENDNLTGVDLLLQRVGIYGIESVPSAKPNDEGPFWLLETRYIYGFDQITHFHSGPYEKFEEAWQAMTQAYENMLHPDTKIPVLAHDEYAVPLYTIVSSSE